MSMMIKQFNLLVPLLLILLLPIQSFSQVESGIIDPEDFNHQLLSKLITTKINQKRDRIGLEELETDTSLVKAAKHHAD